MSDALQTYILKPNVLKALYAGNLLWHTSAFIHFSLRPEFMMRKLTKRSQSVKSEISTLPQGDLWHHDIMAYLGYINVGFAALAGLRLRSLWKGQSAIKEVDWLAMTVLAVANGSQAWGNFFRSRGSGRWIMGEGFDRITVLDAVFLVLDGLAAFAFSLRP